MAAAETREVAISRPSLLQMFHPCTASYIEGRCRGRCCESSKGVMISVHPSEEARMERLAKERGIKGKVVDAGFMRGDDRGLCPFKTDAGYCGIHGPEMPLGCASSPFTLSKRDVLIVRNRWRKLVCFKCPGSLPAYQAHRWSLEQIFGPDEAARICAAVERGEERFAAAMPALHYEIIKHKTAALHDTWRGPAALGPTDTTPVEYLEDRDIWLKREDLYRIAGASGAKARTCQRLARSAEQGLVTQCARHSPQGAIVAAIARELGLRARVHTPTGDPGPDLAHAVAIGAERIEHTPGYNAVITKRARDDERPGWRYIPFAMACDEAIEESAAQVANVPADAKRIVVPVASGVRLAGILHGLEQIGNPIPVLGVMVGADPTRWLDRWAPDGWRDRILLERSSHPYHHEVAGSIGDVGLDPIYEAKALPYLKPGDLLWIIGKRMSAG